MSSKPFFLLVNPPIYDFAAYDLWSKPLGLLYIAAHLKKAGAEVFLLDYLDRCHPLAGAVRNGAYGCGHYRTEEIPKPAVLKGIPRTYRRYGMARESAGEILSELPPPDAVLMTSGMTYWYPGIVEAVATVKDRFPRSPVIMGGTYASLCPEHARQQSGADQIMPGADLRHLSALLEKEGMRIEDFPLSFADFPPPWYEGYARTVYGALRISQGCPFRCTYCAIERIHPGRWTRKSPERIVREIEEFFREGIAHFAFYDDALLVDSENNLELILQEVLKKGLNVSFHSPNGLHARFLTPSLARLMKESNFVMPRLSFETAEEELQRNTGGKVTNKEFLKACGHLRYAGYRPGEYAAYVLLGMPGQELSAVEATIRFVHAAGARVFLAEYSPIPGSDQWKEECNKLPSQDPLWHNNSIFPLYPLSAWPELQRLKDLAREMNKCFT